MIRTRAHACTHAHTRTRVHARQCEQTFGPLLASPSRKLRTTTNYSHSQPFSICCCLCLVEKWSPRTHAHTHTPTHARTHARTHAPLETCQREGLRSVDMYKHIKRAQSLRMQRQIETQTDRKVQLERGKHMAREHQEQTCTVPFDGHGRKGIVWRAWFGYSPQSLLWVSACSAYTMSDVCGAPPLTFHSQPVVARYCQSLKKHRTPKRTAKSTCVNASQDVYAEKNGNTQKQTKAQIAKKKNKLETAED